MSCYLVFDVDKVQGFSSWDLEVHWQKAEWQEMTQMYVVFLEHHDRHAKRAVDTVRISPTDDEIAYGGGGQCRGMQWRTAPLRYLLAGYFSTDMEPRGMVEGYNDFCRQTDFTGIRYDYSLHT